MFYRHMMTGSICMALASVHKYLRVRDLCKELAFGSQRAGGECRSSYNSFEFNVLCHQFLERSVPSRHMSGGTCGEIGISSTVGFDLVQASEAALLMESRSSRRAP